MTFPMLASLRMACATRHEQHNQGHVGQARPGTAWDLVSEICKENDCSTFLLADLIQFRKLKLDCHPVMHPHDTNHCAFPANASSQ